MGRLRGRALLEECVYSLVQYIHPCRKCIVVSEMGMWWSEKSESERKRAV